MITNEQALERGSGRTTRLINALPQDAAYVVHSEGVRDYLENYLKQIDRSDITVVTPDNLEYALTGRTSAGIDHFVIESCALKDVNQNLKFKLLSISNLYMLDEMGMPICVTGSQFLYDQNN